MAKVVVTRMINVYIITDFLKLYDCNIHKLQIILLNMFNANRNSGEEM